MRVHYYNMEYLLILSSQYWPKSRGFLGSCIFVLFQGSHDSINEHFKIQSKFNIFRQRMFWFVSFDSLPQMGQQSTPFPRDALSTCDIDKAGSVVIMVGILFYLWFDKGVSFSLIQKNVLYLIYLAALPWVSWSTIRDCMHPAKYIEPKQSPLKY